MEACAIIQTSTSVMIYIVIHNRPRGSHDTSDIKLVGLQGVMMEMSGAATLQDFVVRRHVLPPSESLRRQQYDVTALFWHSQSIIAMVDHVAHIVTLIVTTWQTLLNARYVGCN